MAEALPADNSAKIADLDAREARRYGGDGVYDALALAGADLGIAIGAGTDVAIETADAALMRSEPLDVPIALRIGKVRCGDAAESRPGDRRQRHRLADRGRHL